MKQYRFLFLTLIGLNWLFLNPSLALGGLGGYVVPANAPSEMRKLADRVADGLEALAKKRSRLSQLRSAQESGQSPLLEESPYRASSFNVDDEIHKILSEGEQLEEQVRRALLEARNLADKTTYHGPSLRLKYLKMAFAGEIAGILVALKYGALNGFLVTGASFLFGLESTILSPAKGEKLALKAFFSRLKERGVSISIFSSQKEALKYVESLVQAENCHKLLDFFSKKK